VSSNCDTSCFLLFRILGLLSFCLAVAVAVASVSAFFAVAVTSVSAFFAVGLDTRPEDRVAAVGGGFDSSGMVDGITEVTDRQEEEEEGRTGDTDAG